MSYRKFKDSKGREFEGSVFCSYRKGVDSVFELEDAYYLDGDKEEVPADEIDWVYNSKGDPVGTAGMEGL